MQHINDIAQEILKAEGVLVNDPDDPGGPTNYGVTLKTMKRLGHELNQDGLVDIADLKKLSAAADARPNLRKFARTRRGAKGGWIKRAEKYMRPRFHLSPSVFQQRTAAWG